MNWQWVAESFLGSAIGWATFSGCAYAWGKRKLLPLYHKHVEEQAKLLLAEREEHR